MSTCELLRWETERQYAKEHESEMDLGSLDSEAWGTLPDPILVKNVGNSDNTFETDPIMDS